MNWHESLGELNVLLEKANTELASTGQVSAETMAQVDEAMAKVTCDLAITRAKEST